MGPKVALGRRTLKLRRWGPSAYVRRGYENVLNAIMGDGEATVLGLRRSKPLFFSGKGAFLIQNSPTKDFQWALPHPHLTRSHSSACRAYQWHIPHQGSYKISPFPMKHQQTFWRLWLFPRWIAGASDPPNPVHPPTPRTPTSTAAILSTDLTSYASLRRAVLSERRRELRRGSPARSHFLRGAPGTCMGRGCIVGWWKNLTWIPQVGFCCTAVTLGCLGAGTRSGALGFYDLRLTSEKVI